MKIGRLEINWKWHIAKKTYSILDLEKALYNFKGEAKYFNTEILEHRNKILKLEETVKMMTKVLQQLTNGNK